MYFDDNDPLRDYSPSASRARGVFGTNFYSASSTAAASSMLSASSATVAAAAAQSPRTSPSPSVPATSIGRGGGGIAGASASVSESVRRSQQRGTSPSRQHIFQAGDYDDDAEEIAERIIASGGGSSSVSRSARKPLFTPAQRTSPAPAAPLAPSVSCSPAEQIDSDNDDDDDFLVRKSPEDAAAAAAALDTTGLPTADDSESASLLATLQRLSRLAHVAMDHTLEASLVPFRGEDATGGREDPRDGSVFVAAEQDAERRAALELLLPALLPSSGGDATALRAALELAPMTLLTELRQHLESSVRATADNNSGGGSSPLPLVAEQQKLMLSESALRCSRAKQRCDAEATRHDAAVSAERSAQKRFDAAFAAAQSKMQALLLAVADAQRAAVALDGAKAALETAASARAAAAASRRCVAAEHQTEAVELDARRSVLEALASRGGAAAVNAVVVRRNSSIPQMISALKRPVLQAQMWASALSATGCETAADVAALRESAEDFDSALASQPLLRAMLRKMVVE